MPDESNGDVQAEREKSLEMLIELSKDDDPRTRAYAIAGLARTAEPRGFAPVLVALFDPVDEVRAAAATALGIYGDERAIEALEQCLDDPSEVVAANCAWAFGQIRATRCLDKLLELIADESRSGTVRATAATAVGERAALAGSDLATSDELIERSRIVLLNALEDENDELRASCVWTLGHFPADKQTTGVCIELLEDDAEWVVRYAIEALAHFGDLSALEPLEELADSDNEEIAQLAVQAIDMLR